MVTICGVPSIVLLLLAILVSEYTYEQNGLIQGIYVCIHAIRIILAIISATNIAIKWFFQETPPSHEKRFFSFGFALLLSGLLYSIMTILFTLNIFCPAVAAGSDGIIHGISIIDYPSWYYFFLWTLLCAYISVIDPPKLNHEPLITPTIEKIFQVDVRTDRIDSAKTMRDPISSLSDSPLRVSMPPLFGRRRVTGISPTTLERPVIDLSFVKPLVILWLPLLAAAVVISLVSLDILYIRDANQGVPTSLMINYSIVIGSNLLFCCFNQSELFDMTVIGAIGRLLLVAVLVGAPAISFGGAPAYQIYISWILWPLGTLIILISTGTHRKRSLNAILSDVSEDIFKVEAKVDVFHSTSTIASPQLNYTNYDPTNIFTENISYFFDPESIKTFSSSLGTFCIFLLVAQFIICVVFGEYLPLSLSIMILALSNTVRLDRIAQSKMSRILLYLGFLIACFSIAILISSILPVLTFRKLSIGSSNDPFLISLVNSISDAYNSQSATPDGYYFKAGAVSESLDFTLSQKSTNVSIFYEMDYRPNGGIQFLKVIPSTSSFFITMF